MTTPCDHTWIGDDQGHILCIRCHARMDSPGKPTQMNTNILWEETVERLKMSDVHGPHDFPPVVTNTPRAGETAEQTAARYERWALKTMKEQREFQSIIGAPEYKDTNPKDAVGVKKSPLSTVPMPFLFALGNAMLEGARKYGRHNYRAAGVRASVYVDAIFRHVAAYYEGQDFDPDSGEHHLVKIAACCAVLYDGIIRQQYVDDRPPASHDEWLAAANERAAALIEKYPNPVEPWTEKRVKENDQTD